MNPEIWRNIFDAIEDPVFLHDEQFRVLLANRAYCREAGVSEAQALGKLYWEVFPPGVGPLPGCPTAMRETARAGSQDEVSVGEKQYNSRGYTVRDEQGKLLYTLHILSDITGQRKAELALRDSEARFLEAMETARDAIITLDGETGVITTWNSAAEAIFGYRKEEVIGLAIHEFLPPPRYREAAQLGMIHFAATGEGAAIGKTLELAALHKDGSEFPIELSLSAIQIHGKWFATGIARAISERKQVEASLKNMAAKFQTVFDSSSDAIMLLDEKGFTDCNPATLRLFGCSTRDDFITKHPAQLSPPIQPGGEDSMNLANQRIATAYKQGSNRFEWMHSRLDGTAFPAEVLLTVMEIDGKPLLQATVRDLTERKQAETHLVRLGRMYRTISQCNQSLVHVGDELELAHEMCRVLVGEGGFSAAWVGYAETGAGKRILPVAAAGIEPSEIEAMNLTWEDNGQGHEPSGTAVRTGETIASQDIRNDPLWMQWRGKAERLGLAAVAIPLRVNGNTLGVMAIYGSETDAFTSDMIGLLTELAGDLAFGIGNLRTRAERMGILEKLEHSLDHAVTAIAATVEMRDPYTAGHQRRVAKLAVALATEMGLPEDQVQGLHMACVVHDIGKIHVPAEILSNPAKLSDAEFEILKTHPQAGWEILKGIDFPWPVAEIVYQHHEKLDGSGYPRGLKGEEILLETRILTVADVVEAMCSHRPYRPGFGIFPALQEISRNKGKLYDVAVVEACLRVFMEKNYEW